LPVSRRAPDPASSVVRSKEPPVSSGLGAGRVAKEEVLELRADVERVEAEVLRALDRAAQDVPRVAS